MWTLVVYTNGEDYNDYNCNTDLEMFVCGTVQDIIDNLSEALYQEERSEKEIDWYLFQGRAINLSEKWGVEVAERLNLDEIVSQAERKVGERRQEELKQEEKQKERERKMAEERERKMQELKDRSQKRNEEEELDRLLRKHGLPEWAKKTL